MAGLLNTALLTRDLLKNAVPVTLASVLAIAVPTARAQDDPRLVGPQQIDPRQFNRQRAFDQFNQPDRYDSVAPSFSREQLKNIAIDADVLEIVRLLDSDDYTTREKATDQLRKDEARRMQLYALLAGDSITPEQRYRLLQIVRDQLINTPRGAMGIEMEPQPWGMRGAGPLEIKIMNLVPGFPAERVLQVGDRIVAIDAQPLFTQDDLRDHVQLKRPGDTIKVTLKRPKVDENGKMLRDANNDPVMDVLVLEVPLGSADALDRQRRDLMGPSRVQTQRRVEADEIMYAFSPQPKAIPIKGGAAKMTHQDNIDNHPAIVNLRMQQEMFGDRNGEQAKIMRDMWQRQLIDLQQMANHPGLSPKEREEMRRIAERFAQLMNGS